MLRFDKLHLTRGDFSLAADFAVQDAAITAVIGPSGGGKSTLLNAVAGFLTPAEGRILWNGTDMADTPPGDRPLAMLFQDNNLFPHLTVAQNVGLGLRPSLRLNADERSRVAQALDEVGLTGMDARRPAELSGGQQSRVALARVLVSGAPLVLLDEPFSALGPGLRAEMLDLTTARLTGRAVLMVSHSPEDAERVAAEVILLADGQAHPPQETRALFAAPPEALQRYLGT